MKPTLNLEQPEAIARRDFLKQLALASTAALMCPEPRLLASDAGEKIVHPKATADAGCLHHSLDGRWHGGAGDL
jgi:hypothetical protein